MLPTYKAILTVNQIRWLETPPAWLPDQPLMIHITFLQEPHFFCNSGTVRGREW